MGDTTGASSYKVRDQIQTNSGYYSPSTYATGLSFFHTFTPYGDPAGLSFIPLSTVPYRFSELQGTGKIFVVGIIAPTSNVTGRLLDRSASVANKLGTSGETATIEGGGAGTVATYGSTPSAVSATAASATTSPGQKGPLGDGFWERYVEMCNRLGVDPKALSPIMTIESGFNPAAKNPQGNASGLTQFMPSTAKGLGMTSEEFSQYTSLTGVEQLYWVEKYFKRGGCRGNSSLTLYKKNFGSYNNPDGSWYSTRANAAAWNAKNGGPENLSNWKSIDFQEKAVRQNAFGKGKEAIFSSDIQVYIDRYAGAYSAPIDAAMATVGTSKGTPLEKPGTQPPPVETTGEWSSTGSADAQDAKKATEKQAGLDLSQTDLNKSLMAAQLSASAELMAGLEKMRNIPPLRLLVNPASFKVSSEKIVSDGNWTRVGPIVEHWGEGQDKIDGSGKIAAFYAGDFLDMNQPGLTRSARNYSMSYQNLLSLWLLYRNNAGLWIADRDKEMQFNSLSILGSIYIYYDNTIYIGSFDNFSIEESETEPFTLEYSFSFVVRAWFLLDSTDDPRKLSSPMRSSQSTVYTTTQPTNPTWDTVASSAISRIVY